MNKLKCKKCGRTTKAKIQIACPRGGFCNFGRSSISGYIYFASANNLIKIGCSTNLDNRMKSLSTGSSDDLVIQHSFKASDMFRAETILKNVCRDNKIKGEWFSLSAADIQGIQQIIEYPHSTFDAFVQKKKAEHRDTMDKTIRDSVWGLFGQNGRQPTDDELSLYNSERA